MLPGKTIKRECLIVADARWEYRLQSDRASIILARLKDKLVAINPLTLLLSLSNAGTMFSYRHKGPETETVLAILF